MCRAPEFSVIRFKCPYLEYLYMTVIKYSTQFKVVVGNGLQVHASMYEYMYVFINSKTS